MRAALLWFACALAGCSSAAPGATHGSDAGSEYKALGQACDPTVQHPCEILADVCHAAVCQDRVCVPVAVDAGPTCSGGGPGEPVDAGPGEDGSAPDAGEAGADASLDGPVDAPSDAPSDATQGAQGAEGGSDGGTGDAAVDAGHD